MKLLFVNALRFFFLSHRLPLAVAARNAGYAVQVITGPGSTSEQITAMGFEHHCLTISRSGTKPWLEPVQSLVAMETNEPAETRSGSFGNDKPVLYGGLIARLAGVQYQ